MRKRKKKRLDAEPLNRKEFIEKYRKILPARWHMSLICFATAGFGIVLSKLILAYDLLGPTLRYGISVLFAYFFFYLLVYLWLRYLFGKPVSPKTNEVGSSVVEILDPLSINTSGNLETADLGSHGWKGMGGQFSGGGASSDWGPAAIREEVIVDSSTDVSPKDLPTENSFGKSLKGLGDADEAAILILLVALVLAIFGSASYIIYQAPEILLDAGFEIVLMASLFRKGKQLQTQGWGTSIFKKTRWSMAIILLLALAFGMMIQIKCPSAKSYADYKSICMNR